jgi:predicted nucleic acid-binding protein
MSVVVDASVALKWVVDEDGNAAADALLDSDLIAPSLWRLEAANALWRLARRGEITLAEAAEKLAVLEDAPVVTVPLETDLARALALAHQLGHPVYDCLYLALAIREDTAVVTADRRFLAALVGVPALRARVRLLGEPGSP